MDEQTEILEGVIRVLEQRRARGCRYVPVAADTSRSLFPGAGAAAAVESQPVPATPAPAPVSVPATPTAPPAVAARGDGARASPPSVRPEGPGPSAAEVAGLDWAALECAAGTCRKCPLAATRTRTVFGEGDRGAALMFVGEAPGADEDREGRPFVGAAGQLLTRMIEAMQFGRAEVYIANVLKCRPPGNRTPQPGECQACLPYLERQIALVKPQVLVSLGAVPFGQLTTGGSIVQSHGQWREYRGVPLLPTFHPSYLLRLPGRKAEAWEDLKKVMVRLGKDPTRTPGRRQAG